MVIGLCSYQNSFSLWGTEIDKISYDGSGIVD